MTEPSNDTRAAVLALTRVARLLERTLAEDDAGLNMSEFRMLSAVAGGEARASRLAHRLAVGKPTVSSTVDALVRRGLLTRSAHDADQRAVDLALTPEADRRLAAAEAALGARVASIADRTADPAGTLAALGEFGDALETKMAEAAASRARRSPQGETR